MRYLHEDQLASKGQVFEETLHAIEREIAADGISILEVVPERSVLEFRVSKTLSRDLLKDFSLRLDQGIAGATLQAGTGLIVNDVEHEPKFCDVVDRALRFRTRSVMCCPFREGGEIAGVVELVNKIDGGQFTDAELAEVQRLVDSLVAEVKGRIEHSCDALLERLLTGVATVVAVEGISILTYNDARDRLVFRASDTRRPMPLESARIGLGQGIAGWVAREGMPLLVANAQKDPRFFKGVDVVSKFMSQSILAVPVYVGERVGVVIELVNSPQSRPFSAKEVAQVQAIGAEVAIALGRM
jgi:GAF domain-containing protein